MLVGLDYFLVFGWCRAYLIFEGFWTVIFFGFVVLFFEDGEICCLGCCWFGFWLICGGCMLCSDLI